MTGHRIEEDRGLRSAFLASLEDAAEPVEVDAERVWRAVAGELSQAETEELIDLAGKSAAVAEAWRLARGMRSIAVTEADAGKADLSSQGVRRVSAQWWALAAALALLAVGVPLWLHLADRPETAETRRVVNLEIRSMLGDAASLPKSAAWLRWTPPPGGAWAFTVRVGTEELDLLVEARGLSEPEFRIPEEKLSEMPAGTILYWRVRATDMSGQQVDSPTFVLELK